MVGQMLRLLLLLMLDGGRCSSSHPLCWLFLGQRRRMLLHMLPNGRALVHLVQVAVLEVLGQT